MTIASGSPLVAYFSMEVGLDPGMPTYSGGLGILAGDTLRAAADIGIPMVGITMLHRKGYFEQQLDSQGHQTESLVDWSPEAYLQPLAVRAEVEIEGRAVVVRAWRRDVRGLKGSVVSVYFLDTNVEQNSEWDRTITDCLYGGDQHYRFCQEVVLGMGGVAILRSLGHDAIQTYHMNEGHSALLALGLLAEKLKQGLALEEARNVVRQQCVFTTHTPVPAGHDQFSEKLVQQVLGERWSAELRAECCLNGTLNMTYLALYFARYVNGVAMHHSEISRTMFPAYPINSITNGVHAATWTSPSLQKLYDRHCPEWRLDNNYLRYVLSIAPEEIQQAHAEAKRQLIDRVQRSCGMALDGSALTIGFARRATAYKRADLLFTDLPRLRHIAKDVGPLQFVFGGKAHPNDEDGKAMIRHVFEAAAQLGNDVRVVYLPNYDWTLARTLCAGVDVWLNTPLKPQEASGTSGMKAALNGVPSLSILDGWWIEGHLEGITGWSIDDNASEPTNPGREAASLYAKLEFVIAPLFYRRPLAFAEVMRSAIAFNGSFFNAQRMVAQYLQNAYLGAERPVAGAVIDATKTNNHDTPVLPTAGQTSVATSC